MYHFPKLMETVWDEPLGSCAARLMCMSWLLIGWLLDFVWMFPLSRGKYRRRKSNLFQKHHHHSVIVQEMKEHFPKIHVWFETIQANYNEFSIVLQAVFIYLSVCLFVFYHGVFWHKDRKLQPVHQVLLLHFIDVYAAAPLSASGNWSLQFNRRNNCGVTLNNCRVWM